MKLELHEREILKSYQKKIAGGEMFLTNIMRRAILTEEIFFAFTATINHPNPEPPAFWVRLRHKLQEYLKL